MLVTRLSNRIFYKPFWRYLVTDICMLVISFLIVLAFFPLSTRIPFQKYDTFSVVFSVVWIFYSYLTHRYIRVKELRMNESLTRLMLAAVLTFATMYWYMYYFAGTPNLSIWMLLTIWLVMLSVDILQVTFSHAYRYATVEEEDVERAPERGPQAVLNPPVMADEERCREIDATIIDEEGDSVLQYLKKQVNIYSSNTYVMRSSELFNLQKIKRYGYDCIVNLMPLNDIRGINQWFGLANDMLPDDGLFVCCFETKSTTKKKVLAQYPKILNWIIYISIYFRKRVLPKLIMTSRLYFDVTEGKGRILSRAEVMGRLCYCGFEIKNEQKVGDLMFIVARRSFRPQTIHRRLYGMLVRLNRVGKNGKVFTVYKFRTMHPYSEYLQGYIYDKYSLREGGKFNHDIRINTVGHFLRTHWIDELPMFINLFKGDMKLVGVRPLSRQYFSLYSPELQELRTRHTPGLLPPFYADMPKTLDEIQASEMRYLRMCETKGTLRTDFIYFWKICYTIIFRRARSH